MPTTDPTTLPFTHSPIVDRPPLSWPGGAAVAVHVALNIEHFVPGLPSTSTWPDTAGLVPDPLNHGWRDYGARVGVWRTLTVLDRHAIPVSALINADAVVHQARLVDAGRDRGWAWVAHGRTNSALHTGLAPDTERAELRGIVEAIEIGTGTRPRGWLGPALTETAHTPALLADLGLDYVLDWTNDDQPYPLTVPGMISVPYSVELNDLPLFARGTTGAEFVQVVQDQYAQLRADAADGSGRVLALALHPFVIGQAFRARYLDEALAFLAAQPDAWLATTNAIATHAHDQFTGPSNRD